MARKTISERTAPSFYEALVSVFNFFRFEEAPPKITTEREGPAKDWQAVGDDLRSAIVTVKKARARHGA